MSYCVYIKICWHFFNKFDSICFNLINLIQFDYNLIVFFSQIWQILTLIFPRGFHIAMSSTNSLILSLLSLLSSRSRAPGARDERRPAGRMARRAATGGEDGTTGGDRGEAARSPLKSCAAAPRRDSAATAAPPWDAAPKPRAVAAALRRTTAAQTRRHRSAAWRRHLPGMPSSPRSARAPLCRPTALPSWDAAAARSRAAAALPLPQSRRHSVVRCRRRRLPSARRSQKMKKRERWVG